MPRDKTKHELTPELCLWHFSVMYAGWKKRASERARDIIRSCLLISSVVNYAHHHSPPEGTFFQDRSTLLKALRHEEKLIDKTKTVNGSNKNLTKKSSW